MVKTRATNLLDYTPLKRRKYVECVPDIKYTKTVTNMFRLPNNWFYLACHFTNPQMISRIQAAYRGYRIRQRIAQWVAAKRVNPEVGMQHLMWHLRMY